jgi:asparagine synthase (glutamine-hydrolysing)
MNPVSEIDEPYLRLTCRDGAIVHEGALSCYRGLQKQATPARDCPFFSWLWEDNTLTIENDRYGFYPLFYYSCKNQFLISPSLLTLLRRGAPTDIDWPALAVFLRLGNYVGMDTPFRHIRLVPPNAKVLREEFSFRIEGSRPRISPDLNLTREAAMDGYIQLFREAIREMPAEGEAVVPLSGGRDSRHIFLELCRQKVLPLSALTVQPEPYFQTDDVAIAQQLTKMASAPHTTVYVPAKTVSLERRKNRLTHMATFEHRWILAAAENVAKMNATVYEGVGGDTLSTAWGLSSNRIRTLDQGDLKGLAQSYLGAEGYLPHALTREARKHCNLEAAQQRVAEELRSHLDAANPLGSFHFWNRTRRVTGLAPCCIWNQASSVWCPYLNSRVFDLLSSVPAALLIHSEYHRFHTDVILRAYPDFAGVPFSGKDSKRNPARYFNWKGARQLVSYERQHPTGTLLRGSFIAPRIVRALIDPSYSASVSSFLPFSIYLRQLEYCMADRFEHI